MHKKLTAFKLREYDKCNISLVMVVVISLMIHIILPI